MKIRRSRGTKTPEKLKIGICGDTAATVQRDILVTRSVDYVSCSPFTACPLARLAAPRLLLPIKRPA